MTHGNTVCLHDEFRNVSNPAGLRESMELTGAECAGHSDSGNFLFADELMEIYPEARWLVVRREPLDSFKSMSVYVPELRPSTILELSKALNEFIRQWEPMVVDFNDLTPAVVERAARFLNPDWQCPAWRTEMLCNMQVQLEPKFMKREIRKGATWAFGLV